MVLPKRIFTRLWRGTWTNGSPAHHAYVCPQRESLSALGGELLLQLISMCAPAKNRTWTNGSEDRCDIRFTTGACTYVYRRKAFLSKEKSFEK